MYKKIAAIFVTIFAIGWVTNSAYALPIVSKSDLNRHCIQKYSPRGIQAQADPYTYPRVGYLRCRLNGRTYGFVNHNQSASEVCSRLTGSSNWRNQGGRIRCVGRTTSRNRVIPYQNRYRYQYRQPRCYRVGYRYICR